MKSWIGVHGHGMADPFEDGQVRIAVRVKGTRGQFGSDLGGQPLGVGEFPRAKTEGADR